MPPSHAIKREQNEKFFEKPFRVDPAPFADQLSGQGGGAATFTSGGEDSRIPVYSADEYFIRSIHSTK